MSNFFADREREQGQSFMENFARESQLELKQLKEEKKALERQLAEAKQNIYKYAEIALMEGKDEFGHSWEDFKLYVLDEQLKEKGYE